MGVNLPFNFLCEEVNKRQRKEKYFINQRTGLKYLCVSNTSGMTFQDDSAIELSLSIFIIICHNEEFFSTRYSDIKEFVYLQATLCSHNIQIVVFYIDITRRSGGWYMGGSSHIKFCSNKTQLTHIFASDALHRICIT